VHEHPTIAQTVYLQIIIFPLGRAETAVVNHQTTITLLQSIRIEIDWHASQISSPACTIRHNICYSTESALTASMSFLSLPSAMTGCSTSAIEHSLGPVWRTWIAELHHALESRSVDSGAGSSYAIRPLSGSMATAGHKPSLEATQEGRCLRFILDEWMSLLVAMQVQPLLSF